MGSSDGEISRLEALKIMKNGGEQLCDYAAQTWASGKYGQTPEESHRGYGNWMRTKEAVRELYRELRDQVKREESGCRR